MDGDDRRTSQYGQPYQVSGSSRPAPGQPLGPPTTDRFSQPSTPVRTESGRPPMTRPFVPGYGYGYPAEQPYVPSSLHGSSPMQGVEMQYAPTYVQDVARHQQMAHQQAHQQPQYASYGQGSMLPPAPPQQMYDPLQQYQARPSLDTMPGQMGGIPHYMSQGNQPSLSMQPGPSQYMSSQAEQGHYSQIAATRPGGSQYHSTTIDYPIVEQSASQQGAAEQNALEEGLKDYGLQLKEAFEAIIAGRLSDAGEKLLGLTRWLVSSAVGLGLHHDDETKYAERLELWREFNICWEALGQKQKDLTEEALRTRRQPINVLSVETMRAMIDELLRMCDQLEPHGLVDYEMGIAEEQITHIFTRCIELLTVQETSRQPPQSHNSTSQKAAK